MCGYCADEIEDMFPGITRADVHAARAYYFDHRDEIEADFRRDQALEDWAEVHAPSKLREQRGG
jgi:hypothetical protein